MTDPRRIVCTVQDVRGMGGPSAITARLVNEDGSPPERGATSGGNPIDASADNVFRPAESATEIHLDLIPTTLISPVGLRWRLTWPGSQQPLDIEFGPGGPTTLGAIIGAPVGAYVFYAHTDLAFPAVMSPTAAAQRWTVQLLSDTYAGPVYANTPFVSQYEGFVYLDLSKSGNHELSLVVRHTFEGGETVTATRTVRDLIKNGEQFTLPLADYGSVSAVPLGRFGDLEITQAMLDGATTIEIDLVVERLDATNFQVEAASIERAAATFSQLGMSDQKLAKGDPGARGATWTEGSGVPTDTAGRIAGDLYLDRDSGDVYRFDGIWRLILNIRGPRGGDGDPGRRGATWTEGNGAPAAGAGHLADDLYLDRASGDVYRYDGAAWGKVANIRGPKGDAGQRGATWTEGNGAPATTAGRLAGDYYLDLVALDVYRYDGAAWGKVANIRGPKGDAGQRGATWTEGNGAPSSADGRIAGDLYLDTATGDVYEVNSGSWSKVGNIKGDPGAQGAQGEYTASIWTASEEKPADAADSQVAVATGTVTAPTGWFADPPTVTGNEKLWQAITRINPATQTGTVTVSWSSPFLAGDRGPPGARGTTWTFGSGAPADTTGRVDGDAYLDTATGDVYTFGGGSWAKTGNIKGGKGDKGDPGDAGQRGSSWQAASGTPTGTAGRLDGDEYLDTATGDVYTFGSNTWAKTGNIKGGKGDKGDKGDPGDAGQRGSSWQAASGTPTGTAGRLDGDEYLDTATGDVYTFGSNTWAKTGNIKGGKGDKGDPGQQADPVPLTFTEVAHFTVNTTTTLAQALPPTVALVHQSANNRDDVSLLDVTPTSGSKSYDMGRTGVTVTITYHATAPTVQVAGLNASESLHVYSIAGQGTGSGTSVAPHSGTASDTDLTGLTIDGTDYELVDAAGRVVAADARSIANNAKNTADANRTMLGAKADQTDLDAEVTRAKAAEAAAGTIGFDRQGILERSVATDQAVMDELRNAELVAGIISTGSKYYVSGGDDGGLRGKVIRRNSTALPAGTSAADFRSDFDTYWEAILEAKDGLSTVTTAAPVSGDGSSGKPVTLEDGVLDGRYLTDKAIPTDKIGDKAVGTAQLADEVTRPIAKIEDLKLVTSDLHHVNTTVQGWNDVNSDGTEGGIAVVNTGNLANAKAASYRAPTLTGETTFAVIRIPAAASASNYRFQILGIWSLVSTLRFLGSDDDWRYYEESVRLTADETVRLQRGTHNLQYTEFDGRLGDKPLAQIPKSVDTIIYWWEENAVLTSANQGGRQWSLGNGATSVPVYLPFDCEVESLALVVTRAYDSRATAVASTANTYVAIETVNESNGAGTAISGLRTGWAAIESGSVITAVLEPSSPISLSKGSWIRPVTASGATNGGGAVLTLTLRRSDG